MISKLKLYIVVALVVLIVVIVGIVSKKPKVEPVPIEIPSPIVKVVGNSVEGRKIEQYIYGTGDRNILFVGGIHGGYEWNSVLLAYEFIDYLKSNPDFIPKDMSISVIPSANPDGLFKVIGKEGRFSISDVPADEGPLGNGRFNANNVDLNRNFDCKWQPQSTWRDKVVSAGTGPFSEPEAVAIRAVVSDIKPLSVIFWHSQSNAVYASECLNGILPQTLDIMNAYAGASGYKPVSSFDAYPVSGDAEGWLASIGIPAITVELQTHATVEWQRNLSGIKALIKYYTQK